MKWGLAHKEWLILAKAGDFMDLKTKVSSDLELQLHILAHTQERLHNMLEQALIFNKMRSSRKEGQGNDLLPSN